MPTESHVTMSVRLRDDLHAALFEYVGFIVRFHLLCDKETPEWRTMGIRCVRMSAHAVTMVDIVRVRRLARRSGLDSIRVIHTVLFR